MSIDKKSFGLGLMVGGRWNRLSPKGYIQGQSVAATMALRPAGSFGSYHPLAYASGGLTRAAGDGRFTAVYRVAARSEQARALISGGVLRAETSGYLYIGSEVKRLGEYSISKSVASVGMTATATGNAAFHNVKPRSAEAAAQIRTPGVSATTSASMEVDNG